MIMDPRTNLRHSKLRASKGASDGMETAFLPPVSPSLFGVSFLVCLNNNMSWKPRPPLLECYSLAVTIAWG